MSFSSELKRVKTESLPIGARYLSLRHCVEQHSPWGFHKTWNQLEKHFGIIKDGPNTAEILIACAEFLESDRKVWLDFKQARKTLIQHRLKKGLPKPSCQCDCET